MSTLYRELTRSWRSDIRRHLTTDFGNEQDDVYPALEESERRLAGDLHEALPALDRKEPPRGWQVPKDEDRKPRSLEEMEREAGWLRGLMDR